MKGAIVLAAVVSAVVASLPADALAEIQLAGAIARLFGLAARPSPATTSVSCCRATFLQTRASVSQSAISDARTDNDDDLKAQFEILNTDRYDHLLLTAQRKRKIAEKLRAAADRAHAAVGPSTDPERQRESVESSAEAAFDRSQADLMDRQAELLEAEANQVKRLIESVKGTAAKPSEAPTADCDILKVGPVKFVPQNKVYAHSETMGRITGTAFTVHYKHAVKATFFWEGIDLPIRAIADSPNCFSFKYRGNEQVLCVSSRIGRDSWIDAMTESWFCRNMGIKGTLPSVKTAVAEAKKERLFPPPPPPPEKKPKAARVSVKVSMDKNHQMHVKVNGKEQPVGKHVTIDAAEYAKKAQSADYNDTILGLSNAARQLEEKAENLVVGEPRRQREASEDEAEAEEGSEHDESEEEI
ncbi:hypothetical protein BESB_007450 [Besnoitia besnoiti]|uniref:Uncharacterized protein n=1 Tax=Besnoitia besnoiti TaxID=94643 RepID=A0A2A9MQB2_BESBE|nr:hypothetical protein BESB_007450 [Besnoitia besnoiti]PFH38403.1 hypothetical protein BESB_007450 [Besnoitia besnoiti]